MVSVLAPLLLFLLLGSPPPVVRAADHEDHYMIVEVRSLKSKGTCLGHRVIPPTNHTWLPVELRHGPCSPTLLDEAAAPSMEELLRRDRLRAEDVQRRLSNNGTDDSEAPGMAEGGGENDVISGSKIVVGMGSRKPAGTSMQQGSQLSVDHPAATGGGGGGGVSTTLPPPGVMQTMVLDTASDVPWVQCVPCPIPPCHPQKDPVYDPTTSPTYAAFSCNSPTCRQLGPYANGCAASNQCQYRVAYPDGSSSSGTYISDMLTLNPTTTITSFQFGCSHADPGSSFDKTTDGIMALGGGPESLVSQTAARFGRTFSYCLPPSASYLGFFMLGPRPLPSSSSRYLVTPMLRDTRAAPTFYRVVLRAIVVGGQRIDMTAAAAAGAGAGAVMVMDSRTLITRLPPTAYQALRAAFVSGMRMYRAAPPKGSLDTCYDLAGVRSVKLPRISMVFDREVAVELDPSGILFNGCLAFAANRDDRTPGIVGSVQQQTIEVHYDVAGGAVGFHRNAC